jgi:hypothetical protein
MQNFKQGKEVLDVNKRKCPFLTNFFVSYMVISTMLQLQKIDIKIINGDYQII